MSAMNDIRLDKVVLHICAGEFGPKLDKAKQILGIISNGKKPISTKAKLKLPKWGLRPGLEIGAKITIRGKDAEEILKRTLKAKGLKLDKNCFDKSGNFAFGIKEYVDLEGVKYNPQIGIFGFDVMVNLKRPGFRVKDRVLAKSRIGKNGKITKEQAQEFASKSYGVTFN